MEIHFSACIFLFLVLPSRSQNVDSLPSLVGYWPMVGNANDAKSSNKIDGILTGSFIVAPSPYTAAVANSSVRLGGGNYITLESPNFNFSMTSSSFTFAAWVKLNCSSCPIMEFGSSMGYKMHLWKEIDNLYFESMSPVGTVLQMPCTTFNNWQYVVAIYDHANGGMKLFCTDRFHSASLMPPDYPLTSDSIYVGHSSNSIVSDGQFACVSVHYAALDIWQIIEVRETCRYYTRNCPQGCLNNAKCMGYKMCDCWPFTTGPSCQYTPISQINVDSLMASLPDLTAYWPLTVHYAWKDAKASPKIDGTGSRPPDYLSGPFGVAETAILFTGAANPATFARLESPSLSFTSSFTLTMYFTVVVDAAGSLFEWIHPSGLEAATLKYEPPSTILFNGFNPSLITSMNSCTTTSDNWKFVAVVFSLASMKVQLFCDDRFVNAVTLPGAPLTSANATMLGGNPITGNVIEAKMACVSIHSSDLSFKELMNVKRSCRYFSTQCPHNCENGGTCVGYDTCNCPAGWTGLNCRFEVNRYNALISHVATLPNVVAYWPLQLDFDFRDLSPNQIDGWLSRNDPLWVTGPHSTAADAAIFVNATDIFATFDSPLLNFNASSWSLSFWIRVRFGGALPFFEFRDALGNTTGAIIWHDLFADQIKFSSPGDPSSLVVNCSMDHQWRFVAVTYENPTTTLKIFCNDTFVGTPQIRLPAAGYNHPRTYDRIIMGRQMSGAGTAKSEFACVSAHSAALSSTQLLQVRDLCKEFALICYPICANGGTCINFNTCSCPSGFTGSICDTFMNHTSTQISLINALPNLVSYWPLSADYQARDIKTPNPNHGTISTVAGSYAPGPYGVANTAFKTAFHQVRPHRYLQFQNARLALGNSSWTFATWAYLGNHFSTQTYMTFDVSGSQRTYFMRHPSVNNLHFHSPASEGGGVTCPMTYQWQFIGLVYNFELQRASMFCNDSFAFTRITTLVLPTANTLYVGYRFVNPGHMAQGDFACASLFKDALNVSQMLNLKGMCRIFEQRCDVSCQNGGNCIGYNWCSCPANYTGNICDIPICSPTCVNGNCTAPNICTCQQGFNGSTCNLPVCSPACSNGGSCATPNNCSCTTGWTGAACLTPECSMLCANGGSCTAPDVCSCASGWSGSNCTTVNCSNVCQNGGSCTGPNICSCMAGYNGSACDVPICSPTCANGGNCSAPNTCTCSTGWTGSSCETPICSTLCLNGGSCIAPNNCSCPYGWSGSDCSMAVCYVTCLNGGTCSSTSTCSCPSGWTGSVCQTAVCSSPCVNGGTCSAPNTCTCPTGYQGATCSQYKCTPTCPLGLSCLGPNMCMGSSDTTLCSNPTSDISPICALWKEQGQCMSNPGFMWLACQSSCTRYATCECDVPDSYPVDRNCTCGDWAAAGLCEIDIDVRTNCSYSCPRRLNPDFSCSPYPLNFPLAPNSNWTFTTPPIASFNGRAAFMQAAVMICNVGFEVQSAAATAMHVCDPFAPNTTSGNWKMVNANKPICKAGQCQNPPTIPGAILTNFTNESYFVQGDKVAYSCDSGFFMSGTTIPEATCTFVPPTGWTWVDGKPNCNLPPCRAAPEGIFSSINVTANHTGGIALYSCLQGYTHNSNPDFFIKNCQPDGTWLPSGIPSCEIVRCGRPPEEDNVYLVGTKPGGVYQYGDSVQAFCVKGSSSLYVEPGTESTPLLSVTNSCLDSGFWSTNLLSCLRNKCNSPQDFEIASYRIMNSSAEIDALLYGMVIAFECDWSRGFEPSANETATMAYWRCNENSTWEKTSLACVQNALLKAPKPRIIVTFESSTAVATATTVLAILGFFLGIIVCLDYMTAARDFARLRHNWRNFSRWLRDRARLKQLRQLRARVRYVARKEEFLQKIEEMKEARQLATAGYSVEVNDNYVVPNPLQRDEFAHSPTGNIGRPDHIEGEMDIPDNFNL